MLDDTKTIFNEVSSKNTLAEMLATAKEQLALLLQVPQKIRKNTSHYFEFEENERITKGMRQKRNNEAIELLNSLDGTDTLTEEQKVILARYSGNGGSLRGADGLVGSDYEYYTPKPIAEGVWSLLTDIGFSGGKVLDPCAGVGIFGATSPLNTAMECVELDQTSGKINALINDGPGYQTTISPFEAVAANTEEESYDAIVTNVPFSKQKDARGANRFLDPKYQTETIESYFILRSLGKLKPNGLAAFIVPPRITSGRGSKDKKFRTMVSEMAEFLGAYRLPNKVFGNANANTITDVIIFRKFSKSAHTKIQELKEQNMPLLIQSQVFWQSYIDGDYFKEAGRKYVLGEFVNKDSSKFRDVDRVINDDSVTNIAKLMRKFGGSHIDWDLLDQEETLPITYNEGDCVSLAGQTLQMQNGVLVAIASSATDKQKQASTTMEQLSSPHSALLSKVSWEGAKEAREYYVSHSKATDMPSWFSNLMRELLGVSDQNTMPSLWPAILTGLSLDQVLSANRNSRYNYLAGYSELSEQMQLYFNYKAPSFLSRSVSGHIKNITNYYHKKTGFSDFWQGIVGTLEKDLDPDSRFEAVKYQHGFKVPIELTKEIYGEAFNPIDSDDWCVSVDGKFVMKSDDFYIGNYGDFIQNIDEDLQTAQSEEIKQKLLRMKYEASKRVVPTDLSRLQVSLRTPLVSAHDKLRFLKDYVSKFAVLVDDPKTGDKIPDIQNKVDSYTGGMAAFNLKLQNRIGDYIKNGTITLGSLALPEWMKEEDALKQLQEMVNTANAQFNIWVKSNKAIMAELEQRANDPKRLYFKQTEDDAPLQVKGISPAWQLHGYQAAEVRRLSREFTGINGFDVGLGKTFTALAAVQHMHNIGVKKKTLSVLPNSVLAKWHSEVALGEGTKGKDDYRPPIYEDTSDCLFVGLSVNKDGEPSVKSKDVDRDLARILENKHAKIFMTFEAFSRIRLQEETLEQFTYHLGRVDKSFAFTNKKAAQERVKSRQADLVNDLSSGKATSAPYLEQMNVDSIVIDEAHAYKNSKEVVSFRGGKFLSLPEASLRGLDAQAKTWYIRGLSPKKDGVLCLTATPLTNSPLEIYSMTVLAVGEEKVNNMVMGINGADDFMDTFCLITTETELSIDGHMKNYNVFTGLTNTTILKNLIGSTANIKDADDVGGSVSLPDSEETQVPIVLDRTTESRLSDYKKAYRLAKDSINKNLHNPDDINWLEWFVKDRGEPLELLAHPFNLIKKMTDLIIDPDLDKRATFYTFEENDLAKAEEVVNLINTKKMIEDRNRLGQYTHENAVVGTKNVKDTEDNSTRIVYRVQVQASIVDNQIIIDTVDSKNQQIVDDLIEKSGLSVTVTIPPKVAALLENFKYELANPRGHISKEVKSKDVKQIIFCDSLSLHTKLKRLIAQNTGVPASKIIVVTGQTNGKPEEVQDVQDGFNTFGDENRFNTVIGNEKIEVGINLQRGTQAMHHLTIGWTPDSKQQRDGRGKRQGNATSFVNIYVYDALGTFDQYKRRLVNKKNDWIKQILKGEETNEVNISGGLTKEQMELLIDSVGDINAMERIQAENERIERESRINHTIATQNIQLKTFINAKDIVDRYSDVSIFVWQKIKQSRKIRSEISDLESRLHRRSTSEKTIAKINNQIEELTQERQGILENLEKCGTFRQGGNIIEAESLVDGYGYMRDKVELENVNPDAPYIQEHNILIDTNQNIMASAQKEFTENATKDGAISVEAIQAAENDKVDISSGKALYEGLVFYSESLGYGVISVDGRQEATGIIYQEGRLISKVEQYYLLSGISDNSIVFIEKTNPEYRKILSKFAKAEDDYFSKGNTLSSYQADQLISRMLPEVMSFRKNKEMLVAVDRTDYLLPSPYFPYVFSASSTSKILDKIRETQKVFGVSWPENTYREFAISSEKLDKLEKYEEFDMSDLPSLIWDFMKTHNLKMENIREIKEFVSAINIYQNSLTDKFYDYLFEGINSKSIENKEYNEAQELFDDAELIIAKHLGAYLDEIPEIKVSMEVFGNIFKIRIDGVRIDSLDAPNITEFYEAINQKRIDILLKESEATIPEETPNEVPANTQDEYVAMIGNTYFLNKDINIRNTAKSLGGGAGFVGNSIKKRDKEICAKLPDAPTNSWVVSYDIFVKMKELHEKDFEKYTIEMWRAG